MWKLWLFIMTIPFWFGCRGHMYGYPAGGGPVEPDVLAQWTMNQNGSNELVDVVSGITLSENGSPVYGQTWTHPYKLLSPAINYPDGSFHRGNITNEFDLTAVENLTIELWVESTSIYTGVNGANIVQITSAAGGANGAWITVQVVEPTPGNWGLAFVVIDDTGIIGGGVGAITVSIPNLDDGASHHVRCVFHHTDPTGSLIEVDGIPLVSGDMTGAAEILTLDSQFHIGGGIWSARGDIAEVRISKNATNNSYF